RAGRLAQARAGAGRARCRRHPQGCPAPERGAAADRVSHLRGRAAGVSAGRLSAGHGERAGDEAGPAAGRRRLQGHLLSCRRDLRPHSPMDQSRQRPVQVKPGGRDAAPSYPRREAHLNQPGRTPMPRIRIAAAALVALCSSAPAQDWPTRPVTMVVPFAAGGAFDVVARVFAPHLGHGLGQQVIVENVGAAAGIGGTNRVAKAPPDVYVFLYGTVAPHAYNPALYKKLPYTPATDFAPVVLFAEQPMVLVTRKDFPADSLQEFIAYAKANAAKLQYGSAGVGSTTHLSCPRLHNAAGLPTTHVP